MKAECQRMDVFKLWCWRKLLRVPWTARRSNKSILKEINPEYSLEGLMLKLKSQYFGQLMWREKTLMLEKIEARGEGAKRIRWLDGITDSIDMSQCEQEMSKFREMVKDREAWCAAVHRVSKNQPWLSDWTTAVTVVETKRRQHISEMEPWWQVGVKDKKEITGWFWEDCWQGAGWLLAPYLSHTWLGGLNWLTHISSVSLNYTYRPLNSVLCNRYPLASYNPFR